MTLALVGNPNSGKTTLFNGLTGANQFVGNWPGVTVEKKEGALKGSPGTIITDLPGIYSLSPYTLEEVVAREYLLNERPDAIINIVDGSNLERNLYLTSQLLELHIPMVVAINMMDVIEKNGDHLDLEGLSRALGCPVLPIAAIKEEGIFPVAEEALRVAEGAVVPSPLSYPSQMEELLRELEGEFLQGQEPERLRFLSVKLLEGEERTMEGLHFTEEDRSRRKLMVAPLEEALDDDGESLVIGARYDGISLLLEGIYRKNVKLEASVSDRIDHLVTHRFLGLPIFALVMFLVYYIAMVGVGVRATDWANDGLFGEGFHLLGRGRAQYEAAVENYGATDEIIGAFMDAYGSESMAEALEGSGAQGALSALLAATPEDAALSYTVVDEETLRDESFQAQRTDLVDATARYLNSQGTPRPQDYGLWVPGVPVVVESLLESMEVAEVLQGLILEGIVAGVGAVLGFVPQMAVLFALLAILEASGYMARIAFVLDRAFRKFGLSGKSFIPMLVGTGCGVPGVMATRTIESEQQRRMTIMTTNFIPCGAKVPMISMIAGAIFGGSAWVATSAYFVGMAAIVVSGLMLKNTAPFQGEPVPFVMELPPYHLPTLKNLWRVTWERSSSFIKKAGSIILLSTMLIWILSNFGIVQGRIGLLGEEELSQSFLALMGRSIAWVFAPLGWGTWQGAVATITGLVAKENIVGALGVLYGQGGSVYENLSAVFTPLSGYSFMVFNLLCAPCFAAMGAIKREMDDPRWTVFAIAYATGFAYAVSLIIYQLGMALQGAGNPLGMGAALICLITMVYLMLRSQKKRVSFGKESLEGGSL
ncbi:MAG: ferrous iron transporter B [Tissierellia bacterium]|nr:ferrous iron transporter B [Tissierellia bacterium]